MAGCTANTRVFMVCFLLSFTTLHPQSVVTHLGCDEWKGRLGDMLIGYTKARWVAYQHGLPFLYKPFEYSDQFALHDRQQHFPPHMQARIKKKLMACYDGSEINPERVGFSPDLVVYQVHYYYNPPQWGDYQAKYDSQEIMAWEDLYNNQEFIDDLKKDFSPRNTIQLPALPEDKVSVAVHIRTGGGFDTVLLSDQLYNLSELDFAEPARDYHYRYADKYFPLKFPPLQYYVDQLKMLSDMLNNRALYVYIFTDAADPGALMNMFKRAVDRSNISYACREQGNHHTSNVVEDMFAMAQYTCLIRSGSNYPQIAQLIGNHQIVIYPKSCRWIGDALIMDEVGVVVRSRSNTE